MIDYINKPEPTAKPATTIGDLVLALVLTGVVCLANIGLAGCDATTAQAIASSDSAQVGAASDTGIVGQWTSLKGGLDTMLAYSLHSSGRYVWATPTTPCSGNVCDTVMEFQGGSYSLNGGTIVFRQDSVGYYYADLDSTELVGMRCDSLICWDAEQEDAVAESYGITNRDTLTVDGISYRRVK